MGFGLGPGHDLGQGGVDVALVYRAGHVLGLAPQQHDRQPVLDLVQGLGQGVALGGEVQHQTLVLLHRGVPVVVVGRNPEAIEAQQLLVLPLQLVAVDVDADALFGTVVERPVFQAKGDRSRLDKLLRSARLATHLRRHRLLCHVASP